MLVHISPMFEAQKFCLVQTEATCLSLVVWQHTEQIMQPCIFKFHIISNTHTYEAQIFWINSKNYLWLAVRS